MKIEVHVHDSIIHHMILEIRWKMDDKNLREIAKIPQMI